MNVNPLSRLGAFLRRDQGSPSEHQAESRSATLARERTPPVDASFGRKRVFVGSSTEGKPIAEQVISRLVDNGFSTLPWYDFFHGSRPPLQELEHLTLQADGAVLVATPDDQAVIRGREWHQARDNVLFEFGLFAGAIGRAKCGLLVPDLETFRIPSDFLGVACFETFQIADPGPAIGLTAASLASVLAKPPNPEGSQAKGRRLLRLLGWIRDESFRLIQEWEPDRGRALIGDRVVAVSAFIQRDIDDLSLRQEYDQVERLLLAAVDNFPKYSLRTDRGDLEYLVRHWLPGRISPNSEVLGALLRNMDREGVLSRLRDRCPHCDDCWEYWRDRYYPYLHWHHDWPYYPYQRRGYSFCGPFAWAAGVAEAAAAFEQHIGHANPLGDLGAWSRRRLPPLNDAILTFERRLHEVLFGPL